MIRKWMAIGLMLVAVVGTAVGVRQLVAKDEAKSDEPKKLLDMVVEKLKAEDYKGLYETIETHLKNMSTEEEWKQLSADTTSPEVVSVMTRKLFEDSASKTRHGRFIGEVEIVGKEALGTSFVRYILLQRSERSGVVWKVTFYRSPRGWRHAGIDFDANALSHLKTVSP